MRHRRWGPGLAGVLIDMGVDLDAQAFAYTLYGLGGAVTYLVLQPGFKRRSLETADVSTRRNFNPSDDS